jgi:Tol biopolymer transport system component
MNVGSGFILNLANDSQSNGCLITAQSGTGTVIHHQINNSNGLVGKIESSGSSTTYATSSDYRLKENVSYNFDATTRLKQLKPARFNFIADETNTLVDGFLAHEVSSVVPEAITGEKDATEKYIDDNGDEQTRIVPQGIDQSKLVPLLVKTIQELESRITTLESK